VPRDRRMTAARRHPRPPAGRPVTLRPEE